MRRWRAVGALACVAGQHSGAHVVLVTWTARARDGSRPGPWFTTPPHREMMPGVSACFRPVCRMCNRKSGESGAGGIPRRPLGRR